MLQDDPLVRSQVICPHNRAALPHAFCGMERSLPALQSRDVRTVATVTALAYLGAPAHVINAVACAMLWWS